MANIAIFYDAHAQANHILMNYGICSDLTIKFNKDATEVAVDFKAYIVNFPDNKASKLWIGCIKTNL
jgi:hypothetical protein